MCVSRRRDAGDKCQMHIGMGPLNPMLNMRIEEVWAPGKVLCHSTLNRRYCAEGAFVIGFRLSFGNFSVSLLLIFFRMSSSSISRLFPACSRAASFRCDASPDVISDVVTAPVKTGSF